AAAHRIDVAHADFYPNVNIAALISFQTLGLSRLGGGTLGTSQFGPAVSLPIFSAGRIQGAYRGARADYDEAVALSDQPVADASRDVADAAVNRRMLGAQLVEARAGLKSSEIAYRAALKRYQGGLSSYIDTLSAENGLVAQRRALADLEAQAFALD